MEKSNEKKRKEEHLNIPVATILALAALLIFINMFLLTSFLEGKHVRECHSGALAAAEVASEEVDAAEYYEFTYRTCMRGYGEAI